MTHVTTPALNVGSVTIHQRNGLYSLNDLHKASGGDPGQRPGNFLGTAQTKSLIAEISNAGISAIEAIRGGNGGTYACRELVIAYASWISPAFHLKVIRVFLDTTAPAQQSLPMPEASASGISPAVVNEIVASTTQHIVETLKQKHLLVEWAQVVAALNDSNTAITFPELTKLVTAGLERLNRAVKAEAYYAIHQRAARQGVPTTQVSLNA